VSLLNDISAHDYHLTTGIIGTKYLPELLSKIGRTDIALRMASKFTYPRYVCFAGSLCPPRHTDIFVPNASSWGYMHYQTVETPATTLWELWNAPFEGTLT
jgi:alpha-L-rhamnosidase